MKGERKWRILQYSSLFLGILGEDSDSSDEDDDDESDDENDEDENNDENQGNNFVYQYQSRFIFCFWKTLR